MKKTTIRIAGFLLAAACVALLASCKNPANNSTTTTKKDDGNKPANTSQFKGVWKITEYLDLKSTNIGAKAYLFYFNDKGVLRLAYGDKLDNPANDVKTRATEVKYESKDSKIKIDALGLRTAMPFTVTNDTITITLSSTQKIVLTKVTDAKVTGLKFDQDKEAPKVVENFNTNLFRIPVGFAHPSNTAFKIVTLNGAKPGLKSDSSGPKIYHVVFTDNGKFILTVNQVAGTFKSTAKDYSVTVTHHDFCAVSTQITASALGWNNANCMVDDTGTGKTITIMATGNTVLTTKDAETYSTLNGYTDNDSNTMQAIAKFADKEA